MRDGAALSTWVKVVCEERGSRVGPDGRTVWLLLQSRLTVPAAVSQCCRCRLRAAALPSASSVLREAPSPSGPPIPMATSPAPLPWCEESWLEWWFAYLGCWWLIPHHLLCRLPADTGHSPLGLSPNTSCLC